jgi:hypothetical protein
MKVLGPGLSFGGTTGWQVGSVLRLVWRRRQTAEHSQSKPPKCAVKKRTNGTVTINRLWRAMFTTVLGNSNAAGGDC